MADAHDPPLRLLHLEDSLPDHELVLAHLRRTGLKAEVLHVADGAAFEAALAQPWDVILSDYNLPGYSGLAALARVRGVGLATPFILVSGEIGEDVAVQAMREGASDYLLKANLKRLAPAVESAVAAARTAAGKQRADAELAHSRARLSALAQHLQTSVEAERAAISREIHDDVGGSLTAAMYALAWLQGRPDLPPACRERVEHAKDNVSRALEVSRSLMQLLRPAILEQGLAAALQWLCERVSLRTGLQCTLRAAPEPGPLPPGVALAAYRTAQEALNNVSKHAQATQVRIDLSFAQGVLSLEVADNGRGLDPADLQKDKSFGIRGLHERADTVGGWLDVSASPAGTTLMLSIPLAAPANAAAGAASGTQPDPDSDW